MSCLRPGAIAAMVGAPSQPCKFPAATLQPAPAAHTCTSVPAMIVCGAMMHPSHAESGSVLAAAASASAAVGGMTVPSEASSTTS